MPKYGVIYKPPPEAVRHWHDSMNEYGWFRYGTPSSNKRQVEIRAKAANKNGWKAQVIVVG